MTVNQVFLVQKTWKIFRNINVEVVGDVFYSKLFTEVPAARRLFKGPMTAQYKKLIDMISIIVARLERIDEITDDIRNMAVRHKGYGVKAAHYKAVGDALLWTLEQGLGKDWTEDIREAWTLCYRTLSDAMIAASDY
ncbi:globin domain-containing protein [Flavitalea sp. BT771]|uniref:globin domain-containing protein n=1 Tax=Flavitalea sp. BT771 TaxID=3063329 RepID=UPI0026E3F23F|nr:globin domain-containing protein [Flavitalea sp. BT771]MDO6435209.1 globin domain-containing protein [Flavitalea sp. BT771]MDV6224086.1 globin domain-containing protein [Flavitalea sp. BT771]